MSEKPTVMISSTARDLPDYRQQVMDACLRADMFPKMMEQLSALDADAIEASLKMVDEAEIYIGLFAHRYGYIPKEHEISITQMEYERAVKRGIPRLIFLIDEDVLVHPKNIDKGNAAILLDTLKEKLKKERVVAFFKNPEDLRGLALHSLTEVKKQLDQSKEDGQSPGEILAKNLHHISPIPQKPEPYIAHPYTLLQVKGLIGRKQELEILTDWITKPKFKDLTIFNVVAIGGMGKSALTWTWFNDIAPQETKLAGRVWWSFYESDATFENFVTRTLAYVTGSSQEELKKMPFPEQQNALLNALNQAPYLLVLDGLERILIAYASRNAAFLDDDNALDEETNNYVAGVYGLPQSAGKAFIGKHRLRKTVDLRVGHFLRQLARIQNTRILVSTRLYPADLQTPAGKPFPGCSALFLPGLSDQDALDLWRAHGAKGSRESMLPVFRSFDKHPLLLQLLAYEVAEFREAPGDFDAWRKANPDFDPFGMQLVQVQSHVLAYALRGLTAAELRTLQMIAGFRMPAGMDTVKALLIQKEADKKSKQQPFVTMQDLDRALTILEDRGLLGWDRQANRYDLHPIVRGVVWGALEPSARSNIYGSLRSHFEAMPMIENYREVESVEDLSPAIELYHTLLGLGHFDEACEVFKNLLDYATIWRLSANQLRVRLLECLFPNLPLLKSVENQAYTLNSLASAYDASGQPGIAIPLYELSEKIYIQKNDIKNLRVSLCNMSGALHFFGSLYQSTIAAKKALVIAKNLQDSFQEGVSLNLIGFTQAVCGSYREAEIVLKQSIRLWMNLDHPQGEGVANAFLAEQAMWQGDPTAAKPLAERAWELAAIDRFEGDFIRSARLQGSAAVHLGDLATAEERLHHALTRARAVQLVDEELPALIALAALSRQQKEPAKAREHLDEVWEAAERGPYPLFHADALNVLAAIEIDAGNTEAAIKAAREAYEKAWCDGPPYAYDAGLKKAKALLEELGAPAPELVAFDGAGFEAMPEVDLGGER